MADATAASISEKVNSLNKTPDDKIKTPDYLNVVTNLESEWWKFRSAYGSMCDDLKAFEKVGFPATSARAGVVDAFKKYLNVFVTVILKRDATTAEQPVVKAYLPFLRFMVSAVDDSAPLCKETQEKNIALQLLTCLDTPEFLSARTVDSLDSGYGMFALNAVIFYANAMYRSPDIADTLNEKNAPAILSKYSQSKAKILALRTLIAQSYLVQDPKGNELPITDDMLKFIWEAVNRKLERVSIGVGDFTLYGLLVYLHQLIKCSDACGKGLVQCGFLDSMASIMTAPAGSSKGQSTPGEKRTCAKICWALALLESCGTANAKAMKAHPKLTAALEGIKPIRDDVSKAAEGALWQIKVKSERPGTARSRPGTAAAAAAAAASAQPQKAPSRPGTTKAQDQAPPPPPTVSASRPGTANKQNVVVADATPSAHGGVVSVDLAGVKRQVMVSYTSHCKPDLVKRLNEELKKLGIKTWIYNNEMKGDMYDEMAEAIEQSAAVLICYSSGYFNSEPCHAELNYAREWKRVLIPVRLEDFKPRGWLGISLSGKLYYDFSTADTDENVFKTQLHKLAECINAEFDKLGVK